MAHSVTNTLYYSIELWTPCPVMIGTITMHLGWCLGLCMVAVAVSILARLWDRIQWKRIILIILTAHLVLFPVFVLIQPCELAIHSICSS